jgi:hypothetical protein
MAQTLLALQQRDQARQQFNSGLGLLAASMYPGRHPEMIMKAMSGGGEDAGSLFQNFMQMQQWQQQNQALQAYRQGVPGMLKGMGLSDDEVKAYTPLALADPSFATKLAETKLGVGGGPAWMAQMHAEKALTDAGKPIPWTPGDPSSYNAWTLANTGQAVTTAKTKADDLVADQRNFGPALQNYDKTIGTIDQFMQPDMKKAAEEFLGRGGQVKIDYGALSDPAKKAYQLYKNLMASQFTAGTQDFKGAGRITNQMLTQDAPSQSTMGINQAPKDFFDAVGQYRQNLAGHRALLFGPAQKADDPRLSDEDYAKYVHPNMDLYGGKGRAIPDFSKMNAGDADSAYEALPSGKVFIDTDGQPKKKP